MQKNDLSRFLLKAIGILIGLIIVGLVNYQIISAWFVPGWGQNLNGPANIGSIEVSYVSMAKFLSQNSGTWAPFWYLGFPFHLFYTPLLPFLIFLIHQFLNINYWEGYRLLTGIAYILSPVALFLLAWKLSKNFIAGLFSGILYSVAPSIFYMLDKGLAEDKFSTLASGFYDPRRFTILVRWGEGPHTFSLLFLPLAGLFFVKYLENKKWKNLVLAAVFLGLTALTNAIGFFAAVLLIGSTIFVRFCRSTKAMTRTLFSGFVLAGITLGLISFWYNLSFIKTFFNEGGKSGSLLISLFPWGWVGLILGIGILYLVYRKVIKDFGVGVSLLWFLILALVVGVYYLSAPGNEPQKRLELLPQALRYTTDADMALSLLFGAIFGWLIRFLSKKQRFLGVFVSSFIVVIGLVLVLYSQPFVDTAAKAAGGLVNLEATSEKRIADWLEGKMVKGERVFVPGNYGFYLNYFSDIWQTRGGLFQASTNPWTEHLYFQLANGTDPTIALDWLKITNSKYAVITTPASSELYKEIKNIDRFQDYVLADNLDGNLIYSVPLTNFSLAKVVDFGLLKFLKSPMKGDDKEALDKYVNWIDANAREKLNFDIINNDQYQITGSLNSGQGILVQMAYDSGWIAIDKNSNTRLAISKDPLSFMIINPSSAGQVNIALTHRKTWDEWLGYSISLITLVVIIVIGTRSLLSRKVNEIKSLDLATK